MANEAEQQRKEDARDAAEGIANGYLGGVGAHPSLNGLRMVAPSLFVFGAFAAVLFDIDEYSKTKNIRDFTTEGVGTVGGIAGAYVGAFYLSSIGALLLGPVGAVGGGAIGAIGGAILGEDAFEEAARDIIAGLSSLGDYFSTFSTFDSIQTNRPGQYLSGWKDGAPTYSGSRYSGGIKDNGSPWGLDSPSETVGPRERSQFTSPQPGQGGQAGNGADFPISPPITAPLAPEIPNFSPVTPPIFTPTPMAPVTAPSFPAPKSQTQTRVISTVGVSTDGFGDRSGGERGGIGGGYGGSKSNSGGTKSSGPSGGGTTSNSGKGSNNDGRNGSVGGGKTSGSGRGGGKTGGGQSSPRGNSISGYGLGADARDRGGYTPGGDRSGFGGPVSPVILDLTGQGFNIDTLSSSNHFQEIDGSGLKYRMAWAGSGNGVLVFDADGDGKISRSKEFAFVEWAPSANSDFEALRHVFDTNYNGKLDAGDAQWASFRVAVGDQLVTLDALGIASIDLTPTGSGQTFADGSSITGTSIYTKVDGSTGSAGNALLTVGSSGYNINNDTTVVSDGSSIKTVRGYDESGHLAFINEITTSVDGQTRLTRFDDNGDGVLDRSQQVVHVPTSGGSTKTVSEFDANGSLLSRAITLTSTNGNSVTTTLDTDGDGFVDQKKQIRHSPTRRPNSRPLRLHSMSRRQKGRSSWKLQQPTMRVKNWKPSATATSWNKR